MKAIFNRACEHFSTLLAEVSLRQVRLACTLSFALSACLRPPRETRGDVNKPTTRNTRHANDNIHAKRTCRRETSASRVTFQKLIKSFVRPKSTSTVVYISSFSSKLASAVRVP